MFFNRKKRILRTLDSSFRYIKTEGFNFELIKRYFQGKNHEESFQVLSDQTCEDLDFDLFFCYADRTSSKIGQQFLYNKMRTISHEAEKRLAQEKILEQLKKDPKSRLEIQYQLQKLNNQEAYYLVDLFQQEAEAKSKWHFVITLLSFTSFASLLLSFFNPKLILLFFLVFAINTITHYAFKRRTNVFVNSMPSLFTLGSVARKLTRYAFFQAENQKVAESLKVISSIQRKMSFFKLEQKTDSDMEAAYWFLLELIKITFLLEPLLMQSSIRNLQAKAKDIENVYCYVGEIDSLLSVASLRSGLEEFCVPRIQEKSSRILGENIKHPLIPACIPNSLNENSSILLTGSNMSGKSTFIRSIGLNYIAGMSLNTCFASEMSLPVSKIFSLIRISDDLMDASSYFFKEVDEMNHIIQYTGNTENAIILLDELFKGTNTIERIASAKAILSFLAKGKNHIFVSTHDIELTTMLQEEFALYHFSESIIDANIHFDYKLKKGTPKSGNAIRILELNNYPSAIIKEAQEIAAKLK